MTLSASMILVDQTAVPLATADAIDDLGGAVADGQWILTANTLPLAALMVFGGRLGDLLGLRARVPNRGSGLHVRDGSGGGSAGHADDDRGARGAGRGGGADVPLAMVTIVLTLGPLRRCAPEPANSHVSTYAGTVVFALAIVALVFGLSQASRTAGARST